MSIKLTIHILRTGWVFVAPELPFKTIANPLAPLGLGRKENRVRLPVCAFLVQSPHGNLLFDTGWSTEIRGNQRSCLHFPNNIPNWGNLPQGEEITTLLTHHGVLPPDLDVVLLSHLDLDHVSGLHEVGAAKRILCSRIEYEAAQKSHIRYVKHMWKGERLEPFDFADSKTGPFGKSFDLYGDGTLVAVWLPSHTAGSIGLVVSNPESGNYVILSGDCGYAHKSWEQMIEPGLAVNRSQLRTSLAWLHNRAHDPHCIDILASHSNDVAPQTIYVR